MALRAEYTLHQSNLGDFLGAPVWEEESGNPLSVLSAFARLDMDPWGEASRLASLPKEAAISALAAILSRLPEHPRTPSETMAIADRLVRLLPDVGDVVATDAEGGSPRKVSSASTWLIWLGVAALIVLLLRSGLFF